MNTYTQINQANQAQNYSEHLRGKDIPFERIRRITGYLVGDMKRWGTPKQQEERDRVKHGI